MGNDKQELTLADKAGDVDVPPLVAYAMASLAFAESGGVPLRRMAFEVGFRDGSVKLTPVPIPEEFRHADDDVDTVTD